MGLDIDTFSNITGGASFFKAVGHPLTARAVSGFLGELAADGPVAIYDPLGLATGFAALHDLSALTIDGVYVQDLADIGAARLGTVAQPVTDLPSSDAATVLVAAFDAERLTAHIQHLLPEGAKVCSLDALRLPDDMLTDPGTYLNPLNFATNFVFFRDHNGLHTRLVTANYWGGYGAADVSLWFCLFDAGGSVLAEWREPAPPALGTITVDSAEVRTRFGLPEFEGQMLMHVIGAAGHDVVKYALDTYDTRSQSDNGADGSNGANGASASALSCTHDANAWPADFYAGLPAPAVGEAVQLWVQNSHPCPVPAGAVGLNIMGSDDIVLLDREIPAYGSYALDVATLMPQARWPAQLEVQAGKYFVRPRYEVIADDGRRRIAHANVERTDLKPDPRIPELSNLLGKGYLLPAPLLPRRDFATTVLPTPMATGQSELPLGLVVHDANGKEAAYHRFGRLERRDSVALQIDEVIGSNGVLPSGYGHVELVYDFADGGDADGWLHALFRYRARESGHAAETSFGAHIFNTVLTYRGEPQSYAGRAPGLSTRLFLRIGPPPLKTMCHLIFAASTPWHAVSETDLILYSGDGTEVARERVNIPCGGSLLWHVDEVFSPACQAKAGGGAYAIIRDTTCRLFGYHGLSDGAGAFSLDHMFGF
ncbi:MAG: hypothetical protein OEQ29_06160 [Alphaproteobacteria bacterium]|nr:hypothetical protein [Alphaproteobacteria bacterium]